ncbi:hypothetical protein D7243_19075 [Stutzerimonas stutzeri]|nr:hypothetical protein [Stutzerimonas stutzeri]TCD20137.1 hypothetical protein E0D86_17030 [Pseudomonas sp. IC_126]
MPRIEASGARRPSKGRRHLGSKPDDRDSARGEGRSPRARRRIAGCLKMGIPQTTERKREVGRQKII